MTGSHRIPPLHFPGGHFARDWFQNPPDIFGEDALPDYVRMDPVRLIQKGIPADAFK